MLILALAKLLVKLQLVTVRHLPGFFLQKQINFKLKSTTVYV